MKCPSCPDTLLLISNRSNVEIDFCPQCRGVWLDRGELDKIIEQSDGSPPRLDPSRSDRLEARNTGWDDDDDDDHGRGSGKKKKRRGFLSEMFEFGG